MAGWWAFEHTDDGNGFESGYKSWIRYDPPLLLSTLLTAHVYRAADAASHLFFAYLRSLAPESVQGVNGISTLPISLQKLLQDTEYPPERPALLQTTTTRVVMIVDSVSPTPFALLRRANHFQYRDDDRALQEFAEYEDPVKALTDECRRVLRSIASVNQSPVSTTKDSTGLPEASWSRFEDIGFSGAFVDEADDEDDEISFGTRRKPSQQLSTIAHSRAPGLDRPTTPSWADFLSAGFMDEGKSAPTPFLLPPDQILPPIDTRGRSSQSHRHGDTEQQLEPGELASITHFDLDDSFWWVWITSLASEETPNRKATFGRCALIETLIRNGRWLVMEEMVKGAAPAPEAGAYIAEKKSFWTRNRKTKVGRRKSVGKTSTATLTAGGISKTSIGPDQHARIQAAALQLQQRQKQMEVDQMAGRRGRADVDMASVKTSSIFTLQPVIASEASPAMKWASRYDKDNIRDAYLSNTAAGTGRGLTSPSHDELTSDTFPPPPPPAKDDHMSSLQAPLPPTPDTREVAGTILSEKAAEVALPRDEHPMQRKPVAAEPPTDVQRQSFDEPETLEPAAPEPVAVAHDEAAAQSTSPENRKRTKLKKREGPAGFKKLFGKRNRNSKIPEGAEELSSSLQPGGATLGRRFSSFRKSSPVISPVTETSVQGSLPSPVSPPSEEELTPVGSQPHFNQPSYEPSIRDSLTHVNSREDHDATKAFQRFDQGPLEDMPAFAESPTPRESQELASPPGPPPLARTTSDITRAAAAAADTTTTAAPSTPNQPSPQITDRWARIRKDAAERAAATRNTEDQSHTGYSQKTDGDDETSGEESKLTAVSYHACMANHDTAIESRVARIKARVAELTGNMDTSGAPAPITRA